MEIFAEGVMLLSRSMVLAAACTILGAAPDPPGRSPDAIDAPAAPASKLRLELNVPAYRLDVFLSDALLWSYTVAVGTPRYPTPVREFEIAEVVWNPWWVPPPSEWARRERPQPPGPTNPMGRVKLQASGYYYVHGTPAEESLGHAASHGCIRMSNADALELARLVHLFASPRIAPAELDALEASPDRTRSIALDSPVPFRTVYRIVEVREGALEIHPDVYGRVADRTREAIRLLEASGIDTTRVDRRRLEGLLREGRRERVVVPLDSLLVGGGRSPSLPPSLGSAPEAESSTSLLRRVAGPDG